MSMDKLTAAEVISHCKQNRDFREFLMECFMKKSAMTVTIFLGGTQYGWKAKHNF